MADQRLQLSQGFTFQELLTPQGLLRLDAVFLGYLQTTDQLLSRQLLSYRQKDITAAKAISDVLIAIGPILEAFIAELFNIEEAVGRLQAKTLSHNPVFAFKRYYVSRQARRALSKKAGQVDFAKLNQWLDQQLIDRNNHTDDRELAIAHFGLSLLDEPTTNEESIAQLTDWCVAAMTTVEGQQAVKGWQSFRLPQKLNYANLVNVVPVPDDPLGRLQAPVELHRQRDGFHLTDPRMSAREVHSEIHYCVYCHTTEGDFCSKGFPVKKTDPAQGLKMNPVGEIMTGCPLEEKISEMHELKKEGYGIGALAIIMVDNPMCPATGHRICNDCMKACIYQKQDPVDIPQTETRILTDILSLPWGVEIYDLLTRWNPLRQEQWLAKSYNGLKVLVMGMGPAGFTLAHHLLMEGFAVVGTDGLKIEPLPAHFINEPIYQYDDLTEDLANRVMAGFGGVAEYGITVRWDKNFLKLIYISLMRRAYFQVFGSVRFGGTLKVDDAWRLGFDHLAIAVGAGLPRELHIPNSLATGMRQANDFLMALQLTGAAKKSSLANLQVRLPAVVIGGGLTGIDTATEVQAYYMTQVEKMAERYQILSEHFGEAFIREKFQATELIILDEFLQHATLVKAARDAAAQENREPDFLKLIRQWGGVTIVYRRTMQESPAYKRNHEEVINALNEGIYYAEGLEPKAVILDEHGQVDALECQSRVMDEEGNWMFTDEVQTIPTHSIFVATGAKPNVAYEFEHRGTFHRKGFEYKRYALHDHQLQKIEAKDHVKMKNFGAFTSYTKDHYRVTFLGDTHPIFHGSVVKAIASAKRTYPKIVEVLSEKIHAGDQQEYAEFSEQMEALFRCRVKAVIRHTEKIVELKVRAPMAAQNFQGGQFYRIQNYERLAQKIEGTRLQTEALALIGARYHNEPDTLSLFVVENGASSKLVATFEPEQHLSVMGPTGARSQIPEESQTVMILGGPLAIAHLLSVGPALKEAGCKILFVGVIDDTSDHYHQAEIEKLADAVVWVVNSDKIAIKINREQDRVYQSTLVLALRDYASDENAPITLYEIKRAWVVGASSLLRTVQQARQSVLHEFLDPDVKFIASVHGPMQCMLKGVCAQCLQWQINPKTGQRTKAVYACSWQNQPMEIIDIDNIDERLGQNSIQEKLSLLWLEYLGRSS